MPTLTARRVVVGAVVVLTGAGILATGAGDVYADAITQDDPLWTTLLENTVSLSIGLSLVVGGYWFATEADRLQVERMSRWVGVAVGAVGVTAALVLGAQALQSRFKPLIVVVAITGLTVLSGLGLGLYDAGRLATERALARERDKFVALFENVPNPVIAVRFEDEEVRVEMVNPAFEDVFGYTESDLAGRDLRDVLRPPDEEPERIDGEERSVAPQSAAGADESDWTEVEVTLETDYGQREFVRVTAPIDDETEEEEYAYYVDVTDRKQRRERLQVLSRTLRHDIRNRMDVAYGTAEVLEDTLDGESESLAGNIQGAIDDLRQISEQTREVEKVVSGEYEPYAAELADVVTDGVELVRADHPNLDVTVSLADTPAVRGNDALPVAVGNVVENAVVHNDTDGSSVEISAEVAAESGYVDLRIADDGPGMPDREVELLKDERDRSQLEHTSGLGLWEVSWILRDLGGSLDFADRAPRGTVVTLTLPVADAHE
ncbi:PAS domain-containing sensor histidine kinase [Halomicroarcula sp. F13]|uniref:histidine kinase n=1 Tax=Haloarcula rubra TaxID=2487747 RepID=A0AAW4PQJ6_9EURY|nr:PAS domain-containing sensor histidine kinase [Halomicroarcula rubra]MBX0322790.1 PAS domain-containing sensor histidine kinase [Halomicroarcula rubra]